MVLDSQPPSIVGDETGWCPAMVPTDGDEGGEIAESSIRVIFVVMAVK